ncbi:hypothetical protein JZ751_020693 [Albula glossodonta]|uniref:SOCS box domain-containing protein n=1 Tax=Albula glossodonta TaxID=121402 RepID=A0A8T2PJ98_9TELE|nr:hypothetical protein JZ751_020693 [Albula glossodonta]
MQMVMVAAMRLLWFSQLESFGSQSQGKGVDSPAPRLMQSRSGSQEAKPGQPRTLQDLCRIKIRQCIGLQNLKFLEELPIAKVMKDYLKHKFDSV